VRIVKTEWGQSILKNDLRLVAGKAVLLRVYLTGDREGLPGSLRGEVLLGSNRLGELTFNGPATLPIRIEPAELAQTYWATLPGSWVAPGLEVRLLADPNNRIDEENEADNRLTLRPTVGTGTVLPLTLVPVLQPGQTSSPTLPSTDLLRDMLPLRDVQVAVRPAFSYGSVIGNNNEGWSNLLSALRSLRTSDASSRYYYGVVSAGYNSGIAGIGYVGFPVSAGWDASGSAARVMVHEIGHNLGQGHAPCNVTGDAGYPYPGGSIGTWGYSLAGNTLFNPQQYKDVMSYCNPQWISDYMYQRMQSFLEANPPSPQRLGEAREVLLISGRIRQGRLELNPLARIQAVPELPRPGPYRLRLDTAGGSREVAFQTELVEAHEASWSEEHFSFSLPDPGPLQGLEISQADRSLYSLGSTLKPQGAVEIRLQEQDGRVTLLWDSSAYPYASVAHLGRQRTTLGLWLRGGQAVLISKGLEPGGRLEVALSDGIQTARQEFAR